MEVKSGVIIGRANNSNSITWDWLVFLGHPIFQERDGAGEVGHRHVIVDDY